LILGVYVVSVYVVQDVEVQEGELVSYCVSNANANGSLREEEVRLDVSLRHVSMEAHKFE
jgi:hypothetical protein